VLIEEASSGFKTVTAMGEAFDQAWVRIAPIFSEPGEIEVARIRLAEAILSVPSTRAHAFYEIGRGTHPSSLQFTRHPRTAGRHPGPHTWPTHLIRQVTLQGACLLTHDGPSRRSVRKYKGTFELQ